MINTLVQLTLPFAIAKSTKDFTFLYKLMDKVAQPLPFHYNKHPQLTNSGLSCAIDSVLAALICVKCPFTDKMMATDSELGKELCSMTTSSQKLCQLINNKELASAQCRDPYEFLTVLLSRFPILHTCTKLFQTIVEGNKIITSVVDRSSIPIQHISAADLETKPNHFYISDLLHKGTLNTFGFDDLYLDKYKEVLTVERLLSSPLIIFSIDRHLKKKITVTETLTSPNGDMFQLGSIVVHTGGHYVTYYIHDDKWWMFDNGRSHPIMIGEFNNLPSVISTEGVLYFYFPQHMSVNDYFLFHKTPTRDITIGVFEDAVNPKIIQLASDFQSVIVSPMLFNIGVVNKKGIGKTLIIKTIDEYVKTKKNI